MIIANRSNIWATMAKTAWPVLIGYHSDLYHDAIYVSQLSLTEPHVWYYCVGYSGTTIIDRVREGYSNLESTAFGVKEDRPFIYRCELYRSSEYDVTAMRFDMNCVAQPHVGQR